MTLLKAFLAELGGSPNSLDGSFDQQKYDTLSNQLWQWINENKQYFWKEGSTFPKEHSRMDQMFASGELLLSYGFAEGGIEEKVIQGLFPKTTRGYAWKNGTVLNSNYLGITYNAKNIAGALTVINFLLSPEAQLKRLTRVVRMQIPCWIWISFLKNGRRNSKRLLLGNMVLRLMNYELTPSRSQPQSIC